MSLKRKFYKRSVYNFIDFLADIGGLFNSFRVLAFVMVSVFQYWGSYQFVMYDLFTNSRQQNQQFQHPLRASLSRNSPWYNIDEQSSEKVNRENIEINSVQWNVKKVCMLNLTTYILPKLRSCCCRRIKLTREQRLKTKALRHVLTEATITHITKQLRVLSAAVRETKSQQEWKRLRDQYQVMAYSELDSAKSSSNASLELQDML